MNKRNSIKLNFNDIGKAFEERNIIDYSIIANTGECNINFSFQGRAYSIKFDKEKICFNLLNGNLAKSFNGDNVILQVINFIENRSIDKYKMTS